MENYRYFTDSEGYMYVMMNDNGSGVIFNERGEFMHTYCQSRCCTPIRLHRVLSEIHADCLTADFISAIRELNKEKKGIVTDVGIMVGVLIEAIAGDISDQKSRHQKKGKYDDIPNVVKKAVSERIKYLELTIPKYKYNMNKYIEDKAGCSVSELTRKQIDNLIRSYTPTIRSMEKELSELNKFVSNT